MLKKELLDQLKDFPFEPAKKLTHCICGEPADPKSDLYLCTNHERVHQDVIKRMAGPKWREFKGER